MNYASISIDRREAYYERAATLIASDPLAFYTRAEKGRQVQSHIKPKDLQPFHAIDQNQPRRALTLAWSNNEAKGSRAA
jgi:hypothetical protein